MLYDLQESRSRYYGKYGGVVSDNQDPDKLGRLRVRVPAIFRAEMEVWARPCLPFAVFFVPEVGTGVWVEFEAGNPSFPIWTGCFFTDDAPPKAADASPPQTRAIQTPSGHLVELVDKDGEFRITITHKNTSSKLELAHDGSVTLANKEGAKVELRGNEAIVSAASIKLGDGASEPAVLGTQLSTAWTALLTHTHPTPIGPSGPPVGLSPLDPSLSQVVKVK